jgi:glucose-1-phosphate thymidylyltransferase
METKGLILAQSGPAQHGPAMDRDCTSHLLPVGNKPILFHILDSMAAAGIEDVAIAVSPDSQSCIEEAVGSGASWGMRVHSLRAAESDPVPAVLRASEAFLDGHPFVLQHGDGLMHHDLGALLPALEDHEGADAVLLVHPAARSRAGDGLEPPSNGAGRNAGSRPRLAVAGAQIFGPDFIGRARAHIDTGYADADVASMAGRLARASARVSVRRIGGWRRFDGDPGALLEMNRRLLDELEPRSFETDAEGCRIEGRVSIDPSADVRSSVIRGPVVIGAHATVQDAFIGPYTAIGEEACIEATEIENSIVFARASVFHVGARIEGSVIGREARVGRHFSVSQAMRLDVGDSASVLLG